MPFIDLNTIQEKEVVPGFHGKFIQTKNNAIVYWKIDAGSTLPEHHRPHEQTVNLLSGILNLHLMVKREKSSLEPLLLSLLMPHILELQLATALLLISSIPYVRGIDNRKTSGFSLSREDARILSYFLLKHFKSIG